MSIIEDIDTKTRFLVLHLDAQMGSVQISRLLGTSYSTIRDWTRRTDEGEDIRKIAPGRGRKESISENTKRRIARSVRDTPHKHSTRELASKYGISNSSVFEILKNKKYKYKRYDIPQDLTEEEKASRVKYCEDMLAEDGQMLYETFFADEMGIKLSDAHQTKVWGKEDKKMELEIPRENVKVNAWGAISYQGATSLHIFTETLKKPIYQEILEEHRPEMDDLYPEGYYFVQDNHQSHRGVETWMDEEEFGRVKFPTYSPDLNPIENLWYALKDSVRRDAPYNEGRLISSLERNWRVLTTPENLRPYFENLLFRYDECINQNGNRLPV